MDTKELAKSRAEFIRRHMLLADEAFCAGMKKEEHEILNLARVELNYSATTWDNDILRALKKSYRELTNVPV